MTARRIAVFALALVAITLCASYVFNRPADPETAEAISGATPCNSCDARHQNLSRLRALAAPDDEGGE